VLVFEPEELRFLGWKFDTTKASLNLDQQSSSALAYHLMDWAVIEKMTGMLVDPSHKNGYSNGHKFPMELKIGGIVFPWKEHFDARSPSLPSDLRHRGHSDLVAPPTDRSS
jgi:hypothetical protein